MQLVVATTKLPYPAGLLLAAAIASALLTVWCAVRAATDGDDESNGRWNEVIGGAMCTAAFGLLGLLLVGLGAPAFSP
jgi:hypothetical protein